MAIFRIIFLALFYLQICHAADIRKKRFSIFNLVAFPNIECTTNTAIDNDFLKGICYSDEDCGANGGTTSGSCASGFGVCCLFRISDCPSTIYQNVTYIQNVNFPSSFTVASTTCSYELAGNQDICQIRLDFQTAVFDQPSTTGTCSDEFSVTSPSGANPPTLCGSFSDTHMYVETGRSNTAAKVTVKTGGTAAIRYWNIKVSRIECFNPIRAPTDCVQYYTSTSGEIKSFNFGSGLMTNLRYDVCIRQGIGYCSYEVHQTSSSPDGFLLPGVSTTASSTGANCANAYVMIGTNSISDRYCGGEFAPTDGNESPGSVIGDITPFRITVSTTGDQEDTSGFDLSYQQRGCG